MVANIGPADYNYDETMSTLRYANRAKNIKTRITRNVVNVKFHLAEYNRIIAEQRKEIEMLKQKLADQASLSLCHCVFFFFFFFFWWLLLLFPWCVRECTHQDGEKKGE